MAKKRTPRARTELRKLTRERHKLSLSRRKLIALERGGSAERPIEIE